VLKLIWRVRRIRGQVEAVERTLFGEQDRSDVPHLISAARGAMNGLIVEVCRTHSRTCPGSPDSEQAVAAEELIDVLVRI